MTETPTQESDSTDDELPIDTDRVPDRWDILHDPTNDDPEAVVLQHWTDGQADPVATISLETAKTPRGSEEGYGVEVQDANADGPSMNFLNPLAEWEEQDTFDDATERFYELAEQYPLEETRA